MQLDPFIRDYRDFMAGFVGALEAEGTLFYLDTSLLMWLLRVASGVRTEFVAWCETRPQDAIRIPVWAAHELHYHLISRTIPNSVKKILSETQATYNKFALLASERAEPKICRAKGYTDRENYMSEVEQLLVRFGLLSRVLEPDDEQSRQAAEEVIRFVNSHVLASDIRPVIEELSVSGKLRSSHRVPPGFQDKKRENRYGDVIIWEEIIRDLRDTGYDPSGQSRRVVIVTREGKADWVSSAPFVRNIHGLVQHSVPDEELDVSLLHPLLVHEFVTRASGNRIYVTRPSDLASAIDFGARQRKQQHEISQWLAASHRPGMLSRLATYKLAEAVTAGGVGTASPEPATSAPTPLPPQATVISEPLHPAAAPPAQSDETSVETRDVTGVMSVSVTREVRQYQDALPLEQRVLAADWISQVREGGLLPYKFGRVLAELSIAANPGWPEQLPAVIEQLAAAIDDHSLNRAVLALLTSAYFDRYGQLLRQPYGEIVRIGLSLEINERLRPAFGALNRFLQEAGAKLPYIPGADRKAVPFSLDLVEGGAKWTIRDIRIAEHSALAYPVSEESPRSFSALLERKPPDGCTGLELRMLCAREFLIPRDLLDASRDKSKLTWLAEAGLLTLDMESDGGLGTGSDEENEDD